MGTSGTTSNSANSATDNIAVTVTPSRSEQCDGKDANLFLAWARELWRQEVCTHGARTLSHCHCSHQCADAQDWEGAKEIFDMGIDRLIGHDTTQQMYLSEEKEMMLSQKLAQESHGPRKCQS